MSSDGVVGGPVALRLVTSGSASTVSCAALIIIRIANFAALRRHLGVARADLLAAHLARRTAELAPGSRVLAAGRDRVDLVVDCECEQAVHLTIERIGAAFKTAIDMEGDSLLLDVVIAAAIAPSDRVDDARMLDVVEHAVEEAVRARSPVVRMLGHDPPVNDGTSLAQDLRTAMGRGELFLQYQPKLHLRNQVIAGVEALIRWRHPVRGMVMPNDFIALAEESGDIVDLTVWTIREAIEDQRVLAAAGHDIPVFVNISGMLLSNARFVRRACALVKRSGVKIGFEITETAVIRDAESAIAHLKMFTDIGVVVAIDDYGAGLSSLAYLKRLPARELKIDKLFVTQLTSSNRDPLIVRSTIDLAHAMEMDVVAEGVETAAALALLSVMGCDMAQGFYISRPLDMPVLLDFLASDLAKDIGQRKGALLGLTTALRRAR